MSALLLSAVALSLATNSGQYLQVALLFLTRMGIPYEAVWKAFLESVPNFGGQEGDSWMLLFNVYVHTPPNVWLHDSSFFRHYQLWDRVQVEWGQWSVVRPCTSPRPCMPSAALARGRLRRGSSAAAAC